MEKSEIIQTTLGLQVMDEEAKEAFGVLSGKLTLDDFMKLKPVVEATGGLLETLDIKYIEDDEESIQAFKDGKKVYGAFNSELKEAKREMKKDIKETGDAINLIFNKFGELYNMSKEHLEKEFAPHIEAQRLKREEAQKKKNQALLDAAEEAKKEAEEAKSKQESTQLFTKIKYETIQETYSSLLSSINKFNSVALMNEITKLEGYTLETFILANSEDLDRTSLEKLKRSIVDELTIFFEKKTREVIEIFTNRYNEVVELEKLRNQSPAPAETPQPEPEPEPKQFGSGSFVPPVPETKVFDSETFLSDKILELQNIKEEISEKIDSLNSSDKGKASDLVTMLQRTLDYITK